MNTKTEYITDIIRELKTELYQAKKKAKALSVTDEAQLYYTGVIAGLQVSIAKYEKWLYNVQPKVQNTAKRKRRKASPAALNA